MTDLTFTPWRDDRSVNTLTLPTYDHRGVVLRRCTEHDLPFVREEAVKEETLHPNTATVCPQIHSRQGFDVHVQSYSTSGGEVWFIVCFGGVQNCIIMRYSENNRNIWGAL